MLEASYRLKLSSWLDANSYSAVPIRKTYTAMYIYSLEAALTL